MQLCTPLTEEVVESLKSGDRVHISGILYVARDAAHRRMVAALSLGQALPFDPRDQTIYYMGPTPARPGRQIGSAGPTTAGRMDVYTVPLLKAGLRGMIGKGSRSRAIRQAMIEYKAVYFAAMGGTAALIARSIRHAELIAYADLGTEALQRLEVVQLPAVVINDVHGGDLYEEARERYGRQQSAWQAGDSA
jgi:fumarate hydratase subunit beta